MKSRNHISNSIVCIDQSSVCLDRYVKEIFSDKQVLASVLCGCLPEYRARGKAYVMEHCLEDARIFRTKLPVHRNEGSAPEKVRSAGTVDETPAEGSVMFDVLVNVLAPEDPRRRVHLILNIELQNNFNPGYKIIKRGIYYCCRLISRQYGVTFSNSRYDDIVKVCSLWICPSLKSNGKESITEYRLSENVQVGRYSVPFEAYDMMRVLIVRLNPDGTKSDHYFLGFLQTLLSTQMKIQEKLACLEKDYSITISEEKKDMFSYSDFLIETVSRRERAEARKRERALKAKSARAEAKAKAEVVRARAEAEARVRAEAEARVRAEAEAEAAIDGKISLFASFVKSQVVPLEKFKSVLSPEEYESLLQKCGESEV